MSRKAVLWTAVATAVAVLAVTLLLASGCRLFAIMSPSMGQTAPVGTLVVSQPADSYVPGDVISFNRGERVYTHRVVGEDATGALITRGDLNASDDPLPVSRTDVIGRATLLAPGLGWVMTGLPWLALGAVLVYLLSLVGKLDVPWRWVIRISGWTLVVSLVAFWLRPWINLAMLTFVPSQDGGVVMHVVNTGLFPLDAAGARLASGQDAVVHVTEQDSGGRYTLTPVPALDLWQRILVMAVCLVPFAASFLVPPEREAPQEPVEEPRPEPRRRVIIGVLILAVLTAVATTNQSLSMASYGARITNSASSAGSRTYFNCRNAVSGLGASNTYLAWAMGTQRSTSQSEADLSGNTRNGRYTNTATPATNVGCTRDQPLAAMRFAGNKCLYINNNYSNSYQPHTFSVEIWFRTDARSNGKMIGYGASRNTVTETTYDRHLYLDRDGRVVFGVYVDGFEVVYSAAGKSYADNQWHHAIGTLGPAGMRLYLDGQLAMADPTVITAEPLNGHWKVGCGNLTDWMNAASAAAGQTVADYDGPAYFTGWLQYAAIYNLVLTPQQVREHYLAGVP